MQKSFEVFGKVQGIMFRQTFIRACHKREIIAGATNDPKNRDRVTFSVDGDEKKIEELCDDLIKLTKLNSWGAKAEKLNELDDYIELSDHQVTTHNVDDYNWTPGVEFYL